MSTEVKKYLDAEGLQHLWSKINMQDYPNNDVLIKVIDAIDESKADKDSVPTKVSQLENDTNFISEIQAEALYEAIALERIDEICGIEPVMTLVVDEDGDAVINAGLPDDEGNLTI